MSIYLQKECQSTNSDVKVHHIPCEIQYNGDAKVNDYFTSSFSNKSGLLD